MAKIFLSPPYLSGSERKYVQEAFDTNWIAPLGPNVNGFKRKWVNISAHPILLHSPPVLLRYIFLSNISELKRAI